MFDGQPIPDGRPQKESAVATRTRQSFSVVWVDDDFELARRVESRYQGASVSFRPPALVSAAWAESLDVADLVVWDWSKLDSDERRRIVREVQTRHPELPMLVIDLSFEDEGAQEVAEEPSTDFVRRPADFQEVLLRIDRLLSARHRKASRPRRQSDLNARSGVARAGVPSEAGDAPGTSASEGGALGHVAFDLHDPDSGRIDARRVSELFGVPLRQIAALLGQKPQTVSKTPDSRTLQAGLTLFERIASALMCLVGSQEGLRIWMNAGNPQLDGKTPVELLLDGRGEVVADLLEGMLVGQPG